jgi:DNA-binding winged helix-turn-helix (wHTH) protein
MSEARGKAKEDRRKNSAISSKEVVYWVAGVEFHPAWASLRRHGEEIVLRPKTYHVLMFLLEHRDQLVTKEEIIERVWDGKPVSDDVLARSIAELRKAFGDDPKNPHIFRTVPKLGYGLVAPVEDVSVAGEVEQPVAEERFSRGRRIWMLAAVALLSTAGMVAFYCRTREPLGSLVREAAWWKLDEGRGRTVSDASGRGQMGTITGGAAWVQGKMRSGLWFDGLESGVIGRGRSSLPSGNTPRTISAWIKATVPHVYDTGIFEYGSEYREATAQRFFLLMLADGRIAFGSSLQGGSAISHSRWNDGSWRLVTATYDGPPANVARIFVDGKLDAMEKLAVSPATDSHVAWRIGQYRSGESAFRGVIDDVRVYSRALDASKVSALHRCSAGLQDLGNFYYMPIFYPGVATEDRRAEDSSAPFRNDGKDFSGIQLARSDGDCGLASLRGADVGQNLKMSVDVLVPADASGRVTNAGPYFRSRRAMAGDGLIGGESAGYWVRLYSTGMVKVRRLNPQAVVAFSSPMPDFDSAVFHQMEIEARGEGLQVWVDGQRIQFDQGGKTVDRIAIPPTWEGPPRIGRNEGSAGVAFGAEDNRNEIGSQRVRKLTVAVEPD